MPKRDAAYFHERLQRDFPDVFKDLNTGVYPSVRAAALAAGLIKERTRLTELKNAWSKATAAERSDFIKWAKAGIAPPKSKAPRRSVDGDHHLLPWAKKKLDDVQARRNLKPGDIMEELGYLRLNTSLHMARARGTRISPDLALALDAWLDRHSR